MHLGRSSEGAAQKAIKTRCVASPPNTPTKNGNSVLQRHGFCNIGSKPPRRISVHLSRSMEVISSHITDDYTLQRCQSSPAKLGRMQLGNIAVVKLCPTMRVLTQQQQQQQRRSVVAAADAADAAAGAVAATYYSPERWYSRCRAAVMSWSIRCHMLSQQYSFMALSDNRTCHCICRY